MEKNRNEKTCEQRIESQLKGRLKELLPDVNTWTVLECARHLKSEGREVKTTDLEALRQEVLDVIRERACESLLSLERITTYKFCLSWGGPADHFEIDWSEESKAWVAGRYIFQDWFDSADRSITSEQAEQLAELFGIYPDAG